MLRGSLTLLMRSIRADALTRQAHVGRIGAVALILFLLVSAQFESDNVGAPGLRFFERLSYLGVGLIALAAIGHFSTAITEEKEEGTLGLLLLADLSPISVLLGKSTNRILSSWLLFVGQFPFALLALTLGGITTLQIAAVYVSLAAYLFLLANLALLVSVCVKKSTEAMAVTALLLICLHFLPSALQSAVVSLIDSGQLNSHGLAENLSSTLAGISEQASVISELQRIFDFENEVHLLNVQVVGSLLGGLVCFGLAWWRFSYVVWAPDVAEPAQARTINQANRWVNLVARPWKYALAWKDFHFIAGGPTLLAAKLLGFPALVFAVLYFHEWVRTTTQLSPWQFLQGSFAIIFMAELLVYSSLLFQTEKRNGTLSTVMLLPTSAFRISSAKFLGCLIGSIPTIIACLILFQIDLDGRWTPVRLQGLFHNPATTSVIVLTCVIVITCQLTMLCSLIANWAALPMAMAIMLVLATVLFPILSGLMYLLEEQRQPEYAKLGPVIYVTAVLSLGLQFEIGRRLNALAGRS
ncbi:ABC transporter permease [Planctomicrobium piriforme]|uniref:ABC-type transport system involved in multi-copper enzyme maturation, permease component n=1 Tax=Planctomicrobium piriforme TaxID=1576369 RepID=A0A1I3PBA4_9PLAN|nr:ABC transporter permease subunit [Planctomicrobium piriforme]SFJ18701.1 ABC-type transport system involved in multi-copper enzyme maturation, permease component [Planctomicrobium piriforme]